MFMVWIKTPASPFPPTNLTQASHCDQAADALIIYNYNILSPKTWWLMTTHPHTSPPFLTSILGDRGKTLAPSVLLSVELLMTSNMLSGAQTAARLLVPQEKTSWHRCGLGLCWGIKRWLSWLKIELANIVRIKSWRARGGVIEEDKSVGTFTAICTNGLFWSRTLGIQCKCLRLL